MLLADSQQLIKEHRTQTDRIFSPKGCMLIPHASASLQSFVLFQANALQSDPIK